MMGELVSLLHEGGYSLVLQKDGKIHTFSERGVADLYRLRSENPELLQGAFLADKVVGKGAAALMILGGVAELHADVPLSIHGIQSIRKELSLKLSAIEMIHPIKKDR